MADKSTEEKLTGANAALAAKARELTELQSILSAKGEDIARLTLELEKANAALTASKLDCAAKDREIASHIASKPHSFKLDPNAPFVALCSIRVAPGVTLKKGDALPFDPKSPPANCNGLIEGVHYERLRRSLPQMAEA
jgi:hypothetical protein